MRSSSKAQLDSFLVTTLTPQKDSTLLYDHLLISNIFIDHCLFFACYRQRVKDNSINFLDICTYINVLFKFENSFSMSPPQG